MGRKSNPKGPNDNPAFSITDQQMSANAALRRQRNQAIVEHALPPEEQQEWRDSGPTARARRAVEHVATLEAALKQRMGAYEGLLQKTSDNQGLYGTVRRVPRLSPVLPSPPLFSRSRRTLPPPAAPPPVWAVPCPTPAHTTDRRVPLRARR